MFYNPSLVKYYKSIIVFIATCIVLLDQLTKYYARILLNNSYPYFMNKYMNLNLVFNHGIAFSLFSQQSTLQKYILIFVPVVIIIYILYYLLFTKFKCINSLAYCFILGGAIGNLIDRILFDKVTDFIDWHINNYHWPTFNIADSFVSIGVILLIIDMLFHKERHD